MTIDLYILQRSPPCLTVILGAKIVGVPLNQKQVDYLDGEHLKPEYLKMNPQHTTPTIDDNGYFLSESRAILRYLVSQYAKDDSLYPKEPKKRAVVEQRLDFDIGTLYDRFLLYYFPYGSPAVNLKPKPLKKLEESFEVLDRILEDKEWVAGSSFTIADIAITSTVAASVILGFSLDKFPNVSIWFEKSKKTIPSYEELSHKCVQDLKQHFDKFNMDTFTKKSKS